MTKSTGIKAQMRSVLMEFWDEVLEPLLGGMDKDIKELRKDSQELKHDVHQLQSGQSDLSRQITG